MISGTSTVGVHLGEQHQRDRVVRVDGDADLGEQRGIAGAQPSSLSSEKRAPGDVRRRSRCAASQTQAVDRRLPAARAALGLVQLCGA